MRVKEFIHALQKTSFRRIWNMVLVYCSYQLSKSIRKPIVWGVPISISVEPTTACNLRCPECPSGLRSFTRDTGNMKISLFKKIMDEVSNSISSVSFYFQGEPFIHPHFLDMVNYASSKGLYTITSTNAHFLDYNTALKTVESGLDRLIISVDGTTQEVYEQYRKEGSLEKVLEGARNIQAAKKWMNSTRPYVIFQFLVVKPNEHQIKDIYELANKYEVDQVNVKTAQIYNYEKGSDLIPEQELYSRYKKEEDGSYTIKNKLLNHCWRLWHSCVITWDGDVVPCCFDKDANHKLGNAYKDQFRTVWTNSHYYHFRNAVLQARTSIDICTNCTEGTKVFEGSA